MYGDCKVVINSITYDNCDNKILIGVRKNPETEDSQKAELLLDNSDQRFTNLNLRGLSATLSYDYGSGWTALPTLTVVSQDDITSSGQYQTVLNLVGIPDLLNEDKASKDYFHAATDTKTVKALITEVLDGTAVESSIQEVQDTTDSYFNLYADGIVVVGQVLNIPKRTVSSISFYLKKYGTPTGDVLFYMMNWDETWVELKKWGDASSLTTEAGWKTTTLDTPRLVDEEVVIYCVFQDGDAPAVLQNGSGLASGSPIALGANNTIAVTKEGTFSITIPSGGSGTATSGTATVTGSPVSLSAGYNAITVEDTGNFTVAISDVDANYVQIGYSSSAVKEGEALALRYATGEWMPYDDLDCGYKYGYTVDGVDCFEHCTAYTATFDSEDSLIDVYQPRDSFWIAEGESRLDVLNKLLDYTGCTKRIESDDEVHIFVPTTTGTTYDEEYTTEVGHNLLSNAKRKALVIPNRIVVKAYDPDDSYEGEATSAASYALLPITGPPVRAYVTGNDQATAVAEAIITRLEVNAQSGSATVPMELYSQIWNYANIVNTWQGDTSTGNIAYINRYCMGGVFRQFISFGRQAKRGLAGMTPEKGINLERPPLRDDEFLTWGRAKELFEAINISLSNIDTIYDILEALGVKVDAVNADLSENIKEIMEGKISNELKLYIAGVVQNWQVTNQLVIPVKSSAPQE